MRQWLPLQPAAGIFFPNYNVHFISWFCNIQCGTQKAHLTNEHLAHTGQRALHLSNWSSQGYHHCFWWHAVAGVIWETWKVGELVLKRWWYSSKTMGRRFGFESLSLHLLALPSWAEDSFIHLPTQSGFTKCSLCGSHCARIVLWH